MLGFAGMGLGLANTIPIVFSAGGRVPDLPPGIGIAVVSSAGYGGYLASPLLIGFVPEVGGLPVALGGGKYLKATRGQIEGVRIARDQRGEGLGRAMFVWAIERDPSSLIQL